MSEIHSRGEGLPSSLVSYHHVGADGNPVYSPAQKETLRLLRAAALRHEEESSRDCALPAFTTHGNVESQIDGDVGAPTEETPADDGAGVTVAEDELLGGR